MAGGGGGIKHAECETQGHTPPVLIRSMVGFGVVFAYLGGSSSETRTERMPGQVAL